MSRLPEPSNGNRSLQHESGENVVEAEEEHANEADQTNIAQLIDLRIQLAAVQQSFRRKT